MHRWFSFFFFARKKDYFQMKLAKMMGRLVKRFMDHFGRGELPYLWRPGFAGTRPSESGFRLRTLTLAFLIILLARGNPLLRAGEVAIPTFRPVEIDAKVEIGYGLAVADV